MLRLIRVYYRIRDVVERRRYAKRPKMRIVDPLVFLELVIAEYPSHLSVHLFGTDSGGCEIEFLSVGSSGPGTIYRVIYFPEMRPFPAIYRALIGRVNGQGQIINPNQILHDRRHDLVEFLGIERLEQTLGIQPESQQLAEA